MLRGFLNKRCLKIFFKLFENYLYEPFLHQVQIKKRPSRTLETASSLLKGIHYFIFTSFSVLIS